MAIKIACKIVATLALRWNSFILMIMKKNGQSSLCSVSRAKGREEERVMERERSQFSYANVIFDAIVHLHMCWHSERVSLHSTCIEWE